MTSDPYRGGRDDSRLGVGACASAVSRGLSSMSHASLTYASTRPPIATPRQGVRGPSAIEERRPRSDRLTEDEARHALYVDFEGRIDQPPVLLGCARRPGRGADPWV